MSVTMRGQKEREGRRVKDQKVEEKGKVEVCLIVWKRASMRGVRGSIRVLCKEKKKRGRRRRGTRVLK